MNNNFQELPQTTNQQRSLEPINKASEDHLSKIQEMKESARNQKSSEIQQWMPILKDTIESAQENLQLATVELFSDLVYLFRENFVQKEVAKIMNANFINLLQTGNPQLVKASCELMTSLKGVYTKKFRDFIVAIVEKEENEENLIQMLNFFKYCNYTLDAQVACKLIRALKLKLESCSDDDLVVLILEVLEMALKLSNPSNQDILNYANETGLASVVLFQLGNPELEIKLLCMKVIGYLKHAPEMLNLIRDQGVSIIVAHLKEEDPELINGAASLLADLAKAGVHFRDVLLNRNFAPTLVRLATGNNLEVKALMLKIAKYVFSDQKDSNTFELVENNIITVLCRVLERDLRNRKVALECIFELLKSQNDLYKAILETCKFSRLIEKVFAEDIIHRNIAKQIIEDHYPEVPRQLPQPSPQPKVTPKPAKKVTKKPKKGIFPKSLLRRRLRQQNGTRVSETSGEYLGAVLEYLTAEVLDAAGSVTLLDSKKRITARHLLVAIRMDDELRELLNGVVLPEAGHVPINN